MKRFIFLQLCNICAVSVLVFCGCTKKTSESSVTTVSGFYFKSDDSIPALGRAIFYINNDTFFTYNGIDYEGSIQNRDSLLYGTSLAAVTPIVSTTKNTNKAIFNDAVTYTGSDTINFTNPVKMVITAQNTDSTQAFLIRANVHKIDHELYVWEQRTYPPISAAIEAEKALCFRNEICCFVKTAYGMILYTSVDANSWTSVSLTGFPVTTNLSEMIQTKTKLYLIYNNTLYSSSDAALWASTVLSGFTFQRLLFAIDETIFAQIIDGSAYSIVKSSDNGTTWTKVYDCPPNFPIKDFSIVVENAPSGKPQVAIVGGTLADNSASATVWSSEDGAYWVDFSVDGSDIPARQKASVVAYDHNLFLWGGIVNSTVVSDVIMSPDFGLTWTQIDKKADINYNSGLYTAGLNQSVFSVPSQLRLYVVGGKLSDGTFIQKVWTGKKNETYFSNYK